MSLKIVLDCDNVLADFVKEVIKVFDHKVKREDATDFDLIRAWGLPSSEWGTVEKHFSQKGIVKSLDLMDGAHKMVEGLRELGEVVICTSPMKNCPWWFSEREQWLNFHFEFSRDDIIFAWKKEMMIGDILIDDSAQNIEACVNSKKIGILFDQPWNQKCGQNQTTKNFSPDLFKVPGKLPTSIIRCFNPEEVVEAVKLLKSEFFAHPIWL